MKLWNCRFKGKQLAIVHNTKAQVRHNDSPDIDAIRAALPKRYQSMRLDPWFFQPPFGEPTSVSIHIIGKQKTHIATVSCVAYEYPQPSAES
jgi:hypothetical protein